MANDKDNKAFVDPELEDEVTDAEDNMDETDTDDNGEATE